MYKHFAEEALAAEGFHVDRDAVARLDMRDCRADLFHDADHLVTDCDSFDCSRHAAVLDVQVAGADAGEGYFYDGIAVVQKRGLGLFDEFKFSFGCLCICKHDLSLSFVRFRLVCLKIS